ncbi:MAG: SAM-dependent methyltransferase [Candidatus Promineifilaceae bacterium]|jgi:SAM-dependent methyltransferase
MNPNFFSENSPFLAHPLLTEARTATEVDFILRHSPIAAETRFLDVGCGFGRHSIELAQRGYHVVGIDPAQAMIEAAIGRKAELSAELQGNVKFYVTSGEKFESAEKFDVILCLMTTLGQVGPDGDNSQLLKAICANLKPHGKLVLELPQKDATIATLKPADHFGSATHFTQIEREYIQTTGRIVEHFKLVSPQEQTEFLLSYRLYSQAEVEQMLTEAAFEIDRVVSDFSDNTLTDKSMNMVLVAHSL